MPKKEESYENLMKKLEDIVASMDSGELPLEESMKKFEEGTSLCNKLFSILNKAEGKIKVLREGAEEEFLQSKE